MEVELQAVWATEGWAGEPSAAGRAVWSGARAWLVNRPEVVQHGASWNARKLCRTCGEGRPAWAERGPESECWASETHTSLFFYYSRDLWIMWPHDSNAFFFPISKSQNKQAFLRWRHMGKRALGFILKPPRHTDPSKTYNWLTQNLKCCELSKYEVNVHFFSDDRTLALRTAGLPVTSNYFLPFYQFG